MWLSFEKQAEWDVDCAWDKGISGQERHEKAKKQENPECIQIPPDSLITNTLTHAQQHYGGGLSISIWGEPGKSFKINLWHCPGILREPIVTHTLM